MRKKRRVSERERVGGRGRERLREKPKGRDRERPKERYTIVWTNITTDLRVLRREDYYRKGRQESGRIAANYELRLLEKDNKSNEGQQWFQLIEKCIQRYTYNSEVPLEKVANIQAYLRFPFSCSFFFSLTFSKTCYFQISIPMVFTGGSTKKFIGSVSV